MIYKIDYPMYRVVMRRAMSVALNTFILFVLVGAMAFGYNSADTNVYLINQNFFHEGSAQLSIRVIGTAAAEIAVMDRSGAVRGRPVFSTLSGADSIYQYTVVPALQSGTYMLYLRVGTASYRRPFIVFRTQP